MVGLGQEAAGLAGAGLVAAGGAGDVVGRTGRVGVVAGRGIDAGAAIVVRTHETDRVDEVARAAFAALQVDSDALVARLTAGVTGGRGDPAGRVRLGQI